MNCDQVKKLLSDYLDDHLDGDRRGTVEEHLASCSECAARLDGLRKVVAGLRRLERVKAPVALRKAVMDRITSSRPKESPLGTPLPSKRIVFVPLAAAALLLMALSVVFVLYERAPKNDADLVAAVEEEADEKRRAGLRDQALESETITIDDGGKSGGRSEQKKISSSSVDNTEAPKGASRRATPDSPIEEGLHKKLKSLGYAGEEKSDAPGALREKAVPEDLDEDSLAKIEASLSDGPSKSAEAQSDERRSEGASEPEAQSRHENKLRLAERARARKDGAGPAAGRGVKNGPESGVSFPGGPKKRGYNCLFVETESDPDEVAKSLGSSLFGGRVADHPSSRYAWGASREFLEGVSDSAVLVEVEALNYREVLPTLTSSQTVAVYGCLIGDRSTPPQKTKSAVDKELSSRTALEQTSLPALAALWTRTSRKGDLFDRIAQDEEEREETEKIPDSIKSALSTYLARLDRGERFLFGAKEDLGRISDDEENDTTEVSESPSDQQGGKERIVIIFVRSAESPKVDPNSENKNEEK